MVRLVVHLGAAKCGSTALQHYFARNHAALRNNGILIPSNQMDAGPAVDGAQLWFFESLRPFEEDQQRKFRDQLVRLREAAEADGLNTIVLSGENLINPGLHQLFAGVNDLFDLQCVLYVRRQDDYLIAAWQQWHMKRGETPDQLFALRAEIGDWHGVLLPLEKTVGRDHIIVQRFGKEYLKDGDVVSDFVNAVSLDVEGCLPVTGFSNRSLDEAIARMGSRVPDIFADIFDNGFHDAFAYILGEAAFKTGQGSTLFSYEQRLQILEAHAAGNAALKQKYFPELPAHKPLFPMPHPHEAITLTPEQARDEEHKVLIRAVYRIAEKIERLSKTAADVDALKARYRRDVNREALHAIERLAELDPDQLQSLLQRYQS